MKDNNLDEKYKILILNKYNISFNNISRTLANLRYRAKFLNYDCTYKYILYKYKYEKELEKEKLLKLKMDILKKFNKPQTIISWRNNLVHDHNNGYKSENDLNDVEEYLNYLLNNKN